MTTENTKRLKWAKTFTPATGGRIQKKRKPRTKKAPSTHTPSSCRQHRNDLPPPPVTVPVSIDSPAPSASDKSMQQLETELAYSLDALATISVMYKSLLHAYRASKPELDRNHSATRLGAMEKELLTAYDDLGHQVTHLERHIHQLEQRLGDLGSAAAAPAPPAAVTDEHHIYWSPAAAEPMPALVMGAGDDSPLSALPYAATPPVVMLSDDAIFDCSAAGAQPLPPPPLLMSLCWPSSSSSSPSQSSPVFSSHAYFNLH